MNFDINDSKFTAYALGELSETETLQMEIFLKENAEAKAFVEEMKSTARMLEIVLKAEPQVHLQQEQVAVIEKRMETLSLSKWTISWKWAFALAPVAVIAILVINLRSTLPESSQAIKLAGVEKGVIREKKSEETYFANHRDAPVGPESLPQPLPQLGVDKALPKDTVLKEGKAGNNYAGGSSEMVASIESTPSVNKGFKKMAPGFWGASGMASGAGSMIRGPLPYAPSGPVRRQEETFNTEQYSHIKENSFINVTDQALSTFSIDVDTASYSNIRRFLNQGSLPPKDAVRIEEMINYFTYSYPAPTDGKPFSVNLEMAAAPWDGTHQLVRIGLKGQTIQPKERPAANLVFLIDVSGSMEEPNKLPLLQQSMKLLTQQLQPRDKVAIVVYAGSSGVLLSPTQGDKQSTIKEAIDQLHAGGSTNGAQGIEAAYKLATENFVKGGINRVILATDGDFNVGVASEGELIRLIQEKAKSGVFLSVLGFGMGNLKDSMMVKLADKGNGHYAYIDDIKEAKKVLVDEVGGTLVTIAKDVKIQVEFNPKYIASYRLVGYEKRVLQNEDFNDDKVDAGEIGSGHTVTALYEVIPVGKENTSPKIDPLKYQPKRGTLAKESSEGLTVKLRYKKPEGETSQLIEVPLKYEEQNFTKASSDFQFATAVASFGMLLRDSEHKATTSYGAIAELANKNLNVNGSLNSYRQEFVELVKKAGQLSSAK